MFHPYFGEHTYEIGWVFNSTYQNKGYASEAAFAVLHHGFHTMNLHRIIATCQPENVPSWRVMEKMGMRREGYFKNVYHKEMSGGMSFIMPSYERNGKLDKFS